VSQSQYTVKLSAETVYCDIFHQAYEGGGSSSQAAMDLHCLDEALDNLPLNATDKKLQLAGKFAAHFRMKTATHCITYSPRNDSIFIIEISPLVNADRQNAQRLLTQIVTTPHYKEARAALGIPESICGPSEPGEPGGPTRLN
jgi:hypothetical protein